MAAKRPSRRYRQFTDRRLEILRSAAAAFTRSGFTRATMGDIAEKVQMAKGNLYYYFPSKQGLIDLSSSVGSNKAYSGSAT